MSLGRLDKVELRSIWKNEAIHFTPWLAKEENISLLGEAVNMELEVLGQEERVGLFRADILCKDADSEHYVLIENQFGFTDHKHLGQLLTYASGLDAVTIIWVSEKFTEEHRATLDWLNRITDEALNFFGIEIELYRIGNSSPAPKFTIVAKPNNWTKTVRRNARNAEEVSENNLLRQEYWQELKQLLDADLSEYSMRKPQPQSFSIITFGRSDARIRLSLKAKEKQIAIIFVLRGETANDRFHELKTKYESDTVMHFHQPLDWNFEESRIKQNIILTLPGIDAGNKEDWQRQHQIIKQKVNLLYNYFSDKI